MGQTEIARMFQHVASHGAKLVRNRKYYKNGKSKILPIFNGPYKRQIMGPTLKCSPRWNAYMALRMTPSALFTRVI